MLFQLRFNEDLMKISSLFFVATAGDSITCSGCSALDSEIPGAGVIGLT
jgi:hypothetical protein